ncbi:Scarecrow-like protein 3 [Glycine soja]|uniref:Scarecrow-like protein 3 n=1 Tax=Glycine soja TaxID=3848 RepID=A0A0B2Q146_GLYSO|nr:Scarecrow-like protein 3 [Glycine soja]
MDTDMNGEDRGKYLTHTLNTCAKFIESGSFMSTDIGLDYIAHIASLYGDAMQRTAYVITSHAIAEAMEAEEVIHIIDLDASDAA